MDRLFYLLILIINIITISSKYFSLKTERKESKKYTKAINELISKYKIDVISTPEEDLKNRHLTSLLTSNKTNIKNPYFSSINLSNFFNIQYFGSIYLGSTNQKLSIIFDTGSNILWVPLYNCTSCRNYTKKYNPLNSSTSKSLSIKKNITYAIGYVNGNLYEDSISINSNPKKEFLYNQKMQADNFIFLAIHEEKNLSGTIADGVMGLGINDEGNYRNSFIETLYNQNKIKSPSFSFYLTHSKDQSRIYIGDIVENNYMKNFFKNKKFNKCDVPLLSNYWLCNIQKGIQMYDPLGKNDYNFISNSDLIFDTGTSYIIIPRNDFLHIITHFNRKIPDKCKINQNYQLICKCNSEYEFGSFSIYLGFGNFFNISFSDIIDYNSKNAFQCHFQIMVDVFDIKTWILGDSALRSTLISFNIEEREIKFIQNVNRMFNQDNLAVSASDYIEKLNQSYYHLIYWLLGIFVLLIIVFIILYYVNSN